MKKTDTLLIIGAPFCLIGVGLLILAIYPSIEGIEKYISKYKNNKEMSKAIEKENEKIQYIMDNSSAIVRIGKKLSNAVKALTDFFNPEKQYQKSIEKNEQTTTLRSP